MLTVNYSEPKDAKKLFTFETICKLLIDDGDALWRKKRNTLMDPKMKSILMVVNRKSNVMFIILFGELVPQKDSPSKVNDIGGINSSDDQLSPIPENNEGG